MDRQLDWAPFKSYDGVTDVEFNFRVYYELLMNKVASLFQWENLPETIDNLYLEYCLLMRGKVCWTEFDDQLYCLTGSLGGEPNVYYRPQDFIIANPILGSKQVKVFDRYGKKDINLVDGILMGNTDADIMKNSGVSTLSGLIYQTAGLLADNISSLNSAQINGRVAALFTADTDAQARTAEKVLKDIYAGHPYKVLTQNMIEKLGVNPIAAAGSNNTLMSLIEAHQYILAQFFQEIGISANYNMKRERLNTAEVEMNNGALDVNIWNMLKNRQEAVERINEKYGTDIKVSLNFAVFNEDNGNATEDISGADEIGEDLTEKDAELQADGIEEMKPVEVKEEEEEKEGDNNEE